jgi:prepilin-type N-terminal cleavage/methylation domain-containing protein
MIKSRSGFTIVELLVVIVVIGILASIAIVSYNGVQQRTRNADRYTQVKAWERLFQLYKAKYGAFPSATSGTTYCLGSGFPNGKCREYKTSGSNAYLESNNAALMTEIKKIGSLPTNNPIPVNNWLVGPYVTMWTTNLQITQDFEGGPGDCPPGLDYYWDDGNGALICGMMVN